jgi:tetratricopeptide (TPR) repeat protein
MAAAAAWLLGGCARNSISSADSSLSGRPPSLSAKGERTASQTASERKIKAQAHFAAGVVHDSGGNSELALEEFYKAALADPSNEPLVLELSQRLLQAQQAEKAVRLLSEAAAERGASGHVYGHLGLALTQLGKMKEAMDASRTAVKKAPSSILGYQNLARIHVSQNNPKKALEVLDAAARQKDVSAAFLIDLAAILDGSGRTKTLSPEQVKPRLKSLLDRAEKLRPEQPLLRHRMADLYKSAGELGKATRIYQELLASPQPPPPGVTPLLREQLFQIYLRSGDRSQAAQQLREILKDSPTNPQAYYYLGTLAADERKFTESIDCFEKAILFNPDLDYAYYDLASSHLALGQPKQALETLTKARDRFAANFYLDFYTGLAQSASKEYDRAVNSYTSAELLARQSDPSRLNYLFYFHFGAACERNGDFAQAEKHLRKCLGLSPDFAEALNYLGYMWAERDQNLQEALGMIEKAVQQEPKNSAYLDSLGWVFFKLKRTDEALKHIQQAVEYSEKPDPTVLDHLGDIQAALGRVEEAMAAWRQSIELEPNEQIKKKIGELDGGGGKP